MRKLNDKQIEEAADNLIILLTKYKRTIHKYLGSNEIEDIYQVAKLATSKLKEGIDKK